MIFPPSQAWGIARGEVTMARRLVRAGEERCRYRPGCSYAVQPGPGGSSIGRLVVTRTRREALGAVTVADARREGHGGRAPLTAFVFAWLAQHDREWRDVLDLVSDEEAAERFRARWARREVWVLEFIRDPAVAPRLLHRHSERGYTAAPSDAMPDEPEAVDEWTQATITREANMRDEQRAEDRRREARDQLAVALQDIASRMQNARLVAAAGGLDVDEHLRRADQRVRRASRELGQGGRAA
ncbi:hypothetical protein [Miltoncostaea marina]|uniref:hypothetical protein n=1 Tax=Miltoncostaea marina TaxID=2843215 RepID=UPI001C3CECA0|nr:hypothetical protein [Miltoncostaea marina]